MQKHLRVVKLPSICSVLSHTRPYSEILATILPVQAKSHNCDMIEKAEEELEGNEAVCQASVKTRHYNWSRTCPLASEERGRPLKASLEERWWSISLTIYDVYRLPG